MKLYILILLLIFSCNSKHTDKRGKSDSTNDTTNKNENVDELTNSNVEILEIFVDSINIGEKGLNKIKLLKHRVFNDYYVIVKFYTKESLENTWYIKNTYLYECDVSENLNPNIDDFNNDNYNDITFISTQAARMSNEVRRLFVYNDYKRELTSIVNSEDYPNMLYNKELN
jgi:hypothetical protein